MHRRTIRSVAGACLLLASAAPFAQTWPARTVRMVAPFTAGGPVDLNARIVAQKLTESWNQQVVVDNRVGASGMIGAEGVAKAAPDGYTLLVNSSIHVIVPSLFPKMTYDPIRDFVAVSMLSTAPLVLLANPSLPVRTVKELIALAKARPGELTFGSAGSGSSTHLTGELLKSVTGTQMVHIPYKGSSQVLVDVISGQIPMMFNSLAGSPEFVKSGRVRAIAVTSAKRTALFPDVPTFAESGYKDLVTGSWYGVWAPAKTPEAIITRIAGDLGRIIALADVRTRMIEVGSEPAGSGPAEFDAFQKAEAARWAKVVRDSGAKAQ